MKTKIKEALKTKFEGVEDGILDRIAEKAAKTITSEEEVETYIKGVTFQTVLGAYGDSRATEAAKNAVTNYEKKYKVKNGKPVEGVEKPTVTVEPSPDDVPAWAKALIDSNKALQERMTKMDEDKTSSARKAQLETVIAGLPEPIKALYVDSFDRMSFKDDDDFATWMKAKKDEVENVNKTVLAKTGIVTPPKAGGSGTGEVNAALKAQVEAQKAASVKTGAATILGMPSDGN